MADDKKVKKTKKKKEEEEGAAPAPAAAPAAEEPKRSSARESKKAVKRTGSNVFSLFSQRQLSEFKEAFQMMDADKDGIIGKSDLRATFDAMGKVANDREMDEMLGEPNGPLNFTMLLTLFANRMSGSADDDEVVIAAFKSFDDNGKIDGDKLKHALMTFGEKFSQSEIDDAYEQMTIDNSGRIDTGKLISMLTASAEGEGEEDGEAA